MWLPVASYVMMYPHVSVIILILSKTVTVMQAASACSCICFFISYTHKHDTQTHFYHAGDMLQLPGGGATAPGAPSDAVTG